MRVDLQAQFTLDFFPSGPFPNPNQEQLTEERSINILLFGLSNSGKSSFINSCYSLLSSSLQFDIAQCGGNTRVTSELTPYRLACLNLRQRTHFRLWDTWGLGEGLYQNQEFVALCLGKTRFGLKMEEASLTDWKKIPTKDSAKQSCIIFFAVAADVARNSPELNDLIPFIREAKYLGNGCFFCLIKVRTSYRCRSFESGCSLSWF